MTSFLLSARATAIALTLLVIGNPAAAREGWIIKDSPASVEKTADQLETAIENAGATVFARVDHAGGAKSIDAELTDMTLVIFGNPKIGTPILQAEPHAGLDLPIRVLIWSDEGQTKIGYLDPAALQARYSVEGADQSFAMMKGALEKLTAAAAQ